MFKKIFACLFLLLSMAMLAFAIRYSQHMIEAGEQVVIPIEERLTPIISNTAGPTEKTISVLFIGNSFTSTNDLPAMFTNIASSDPTNKTKFEIYSETKDSSTLEQTRTEGKAYKLIQSRHFDFVVLQEQTLWAFSDSGYQNAYLGVNYWNEAVKKNGGTTVFFQTWSDKNGSSLYKGIGMDVDDGQEKISRSSKDLGDYFHIPIVPVGDYWNYVKHQPNAPDLYNGDFHHPNVAGTYLSALAFYRYISSLKPDHVTFVPHGLPDADAAYLRSVVAM